MRTTALMISLLVLGVTAASAGTFSPTPYLADAQVEVLTRSVANQQFNRDLFGKPYATVVVGNIDIYDRFPYLESRHFQIVSDPEWNRLLLGEVNKTPSAFDGSQSSFGKLAAPRGLSSDGQGRIYVADTGNDRVLVFQTVTEFDRVVLEPVHAIDDLNKPYDIAYSDAGTPFDPADDLLYVANTGKNEVRRYELSDASATLTDVVGELGSGDLRFAGPMAITVGHSQGVHSEDVFVSDAHNSRVVRLRDTGSALDWVGATPHDMGLITSLDTDHWGNVYAASPQADKVAKYSPSLFQVASLDGQVDRPRSFHVPFANVTDHRTGEKSRTGQGSGIVVEEWNGKNGIRRMNLGVELTDPSVVSESGTEVRVTLTDNASVTAEIMDPSNGQVIARRDVGLLAAGPNTVEFRPQDYVAGWTPGEYEMIVHASSTYDKSRVSDVALVFAMNGSGGPALPDKLALLGNTPNPFNPTTTIRFTIPAGATRDYNLRVYDVAGRLVRDLAAGAAGEGLHSVVWDGRNNGGRSVSSGIYIYQLEVGPEIFTGKMVLVK